MNKKCLLINANILSLVPTDGSECGVGTENIQDMHP